ncbi:MAG: DUF2478 domain-containing protein [Gemmobacter sp.]
MLGVVSAEGQGAGDRLLRDVALALQSEGLRLAGVVQLNVERPGRPRCDMELELLDGTGVVRISQDLGRNSRGCRIDAAGLEAAAGRVMAAVEAGNVDLVIVNKFGKQEAEGRGFRPLIAEALARGIPVLTAVKPGNAEAFEAFAGGLAEPVAPHGDAILAWARGACAAAQPT